MFGIRLDAFVLWERGGEFTPKSQNSARWSDDFLWRCGWFIFSLGGVGKLGTNLGFVA